MNIDINLKITNVNNQDFTDILFQKFFNMVFVDPKGKTLHIYTATVFTGAEKNNSSENCPIPLKSDTKCRLDFSYDVSGALKINFDDITESLVRQYRQLDKVWNQCEELNTQADVTQTVKQLYQKSYNVPPMERHFLFIHDQSKEMLHSCVVREGLYETQHDDSKKYSLSCEQNYGVEAINWVRTTIVMSESILNKSISFKISFAGAHFYTPDFTWYFAPPANYIVDGDSTEVKVGDDSEKNGIASVADRTTVEFEEWVKEEQIDERNKARVISLKDLIKGDMTCLSNNPIQVGLTFINPQKHVNRQFFIGLLVAFALSYCSDKTRLNDYLLCVKEYCTCSDCACSGLNNFQGLVFPFLILLAFVSMVFRGKTCLPTTNRMKIIMGALKFGGIFATVFLMLYVFGLWLIVPNLVNHIVNNCKLNNIIIITSMACSAIGNLVYILYCIFRRKRNVTDYL